MYEFVDLHVSLLHLNSLSKPLTDKLNMRTTSGLISTLLQTAGRLLASNPVLGNAAAAWRKQQPTSSSSLKKQSIQRFSVPSLLPSPPISISLGSSGTTVEKLESVSTAEVKSPREPEPETFVRLANPDDIVLLGDSFADLLELLNDGIYENAPELCDDCEGGTYFLLDPEGERIAVFKPIDEDPQAVNNPKRKDDSPARLTIPQGGAAQREIAAYLIDRGFAGVPETAMVHVKHPSFGGGVKIGSLQKFVEHECGSWDLPPYRFATEDVHRIGLFDLRCFNTDRHGGNMLAVRKQHSSSDHQQSDKTTSLKEGTHGLTPIDHGFAFATDFGEENFEWRFWPQAKRPFSSATRELVANISLEKDIQVLRGQGLCERAIWVHRVMTTFTMKGVAAGATLSELADLCCRKRQQVSELEILCSQAQERSRQQGSDFWQLLDDALDVLFASRRSG